MAMTIDELKRTVFPRESGGDYDALYGFSNRPGGKFSNVKLTDMTVDQALAFANPSGVYGQWVKSTRPDKQYGIATPMGAFQIVGTTLRGAKQGMGLTGNERMTPEMQDKIATWIYNTQGPSAWSLPAGGGTGGGGRIASSSGGTPAMGLMDFQQSPEPQTFKERLQEGIKSGALWDNLALAFNSMRLNPDQGIGQIVQSRQEQRAQERKTARERNATAEWLRAQGATALADGVMSGGVPASTAFSLYQAQARAADDPNVQTSAMLPDQSGTVLTMRDGSLRVVTAGNETLTGQAAVDFVKKAQEQNVEYQQNVYKARRLGTGLGETAAADLSAAPSMISTADQTLGYIDQIRKHPGLESGTGFSSTFNVVPGTPGYDFQNRVKQVASGAFMTAIQDLRGMGALSNAEGETATKAVARLDTATSKEEFLAALSDYERIVVAGKQRAQALLAQQPGAGAAGPAVPTPRRMRFDENGNLIND